MASLLHVPIILTSSAIQSASLIIFSATNDIRVYRVVTGLSEREFV
jgi:hypothetical protein